MALEAHDIGDDDLASLYRDHGARLRRLIRRRVPHHLVDDTLHDTFLRAHASWARLDLGLPVFPYLATLAYRACRETLRREGQFAQRAASASLTTRVSEPHDELENAQRAELLWTAWMALEPRQRRLLYRRHVVGEPYAAMSSDEGASVEALRAAVHRARRALAIRYRELAERTGALVGIGVPLTRLRARFRGLVLRAKTTADSAAGASATALACVAVTTFAVVSAVTVSRTAGATTTVDTSLASLAAFASGAAAPAFETTGNEFPAVVSPTQRAVPAPSKPPPRLIAVNAQPDLTVGHDGTEASITLVIEDPTGASGHRTEIPVHCNRGTVSTALCTIAGAVPDE
jgi:RNA polymerase sigma factor (sigma-70 family)